MSELPRVITVDEYRGQTAVAVSATQHDEHTASQARRVVQEWVDFFSSGPSPITDLRFTSRTPARLFDALAAQTQLRRLELKWGDYSDLTVLSGMSRLRALVLRGAVRVSSVAPLARLEALEALTIESLRDLHDLAPLAALRNVTDLELGGDWMSPRYAHIDSIEFLREMPQLRYLLLHSIIVDSKDYSPVLDLPLLERVRVMKTRGMRPSYDELRQSLPWEA